jgi:chemotaxis signal transduction protein
MHLLAIPAEQVLEMFVLPEVRRPPGVPAWQRGVTLLRGSALPAVDLRVCLGLESSEHELGAFLEELRGREADHRAWLAELEASTREGRPFGLATDPRLCKFGRWYYAFKTDDAVVRGALAAFETPHAAIHALAGQVAALRAEGRQADAIKRLEAARTGLLAELIEVFARTAQVVRQQHREVGAVVRLGKREVVLIVDRADAVAELEPIEAGDDPLRDGTLRVELVSRLARWRGAPQPVLVLELERLAAMAG